MNWTVIQRILGLLLMVFSVTMLPPIAFSLMFEDGHFLNNNYTVWGRVVDGMEHVDNIKRGAGQSGSVSEPDKMIKVTLSAE